MADDSLPPVEPLSPPWRERLLDALAHVHHDLLLVGPYIKDNVMTLVKHALAARLDPQPLTVRVITRILPDDFLSGASDIAALQHMLLWPAEFAGASLEMRVINNLHAKVWVFDADLAIVGSGNATMSGLEGNLEYGLVVAEPQLVEHILRDWQVWWEQATPIDGEMLEKVGQWLNAIANDEEIRRAEKMAQEKRQAAERRIGVTPRIGKRVILAPNERQARHTTQEKFYIPYTAPDIEVVEQVHSATPPIEIQVPASHLWQALCWTTPLVNTEPQPDATMSALLKITTKPASSGKQVVQCIWADGKRFSQATIQAYALEPQSWTITMGSSAISQLSEFLQHIPGVITSGDQTRSELFLRWQSSPSRFLVRQANVESSVPLVVTCMPAVMPGNFPVLRPPLSQIVIEQELFFAKLMELKQNWGIRDSATSETVELTFGTPGPVSALQLSFGPIEAPLIIPVTGTECILSGPEIRLWLDLASFWHILANAQGRVLRWQLRAGRDAEAVQFFPEFDHGMDWADAPVWRHELRNVAG